MNMIQSEIISFQELINQFGLVKRQKLKNDGSQENDAEHSYQLAMICWYLYKKLNLKLDLGLIFKYALIHDLPEVYAGDIDSFTTDKASLRAKPKNELVAINKIQSEYPVFDELVVLFESYENQKDEESKFVYSVDKIVPVVNVYLFKDDKYFLNRKLTLQNVKDERIPRIQSLQIRNLFENEILPYLDKMGIFYKPE